MPFVQRVVQPTRLAQVSSTAADRARTLRFHCLPGKCQNNSCINYRPTANVANDSQQQQDESAVLSRTAASVKDKNQQEEEEHPSNTTTTVTQAVIHVSQQNGTEVATATVLSTTTTSTTPTPTSPQNHNHTNGFACSFSYATDTEETLRSPLPSPNSPPALSMKKLKQHVEFLSSAPSPSRSLTRSDGHGSRSNSQTRMQQQKQLQMRRQRPQSPTAAKIVSGYEFDSISNITLSNALRQLASLVLIASDIFEELQSELQAVGERARCVQRKIVAVERKVTAYDPKMVTVPESDLLTFAQRKTHYESDKSFRKELFTASTRPRSVRTLYEEAGKVTPPPTPATAASSPYSPHSFANADGTIVDGDGVLVDGISSTGALTAAGSDELVCTPVFGKANRKMRTRIDAEIEIRLPAAIEDLRKWTSTEALGDVTVTPDCMHHVDTSISTSMVIGDNGVLTPALSPSVLSADAVDALYSINTSHVGDSTQLPNDINKDVPLNHRLPSPEEQCKIIALRYPAEVISVDTSGKRFQRMCMARKSTTGCYTNISDANNLNDDVQTVSRRSRSRKVRGKRRNTIAGTDQKEIQDAANGDTTASGGEPKTTAAGAATTESHEEDSRRSEKSKKFGRSKSSDILKKDSVALPYDKGKNTLTRLNSLKQWGRNRFKFMHRSESTPATTSDSGAHDVSGSSTSSQHTNNEKVEAAAATTSSSSKSSASKPVGTKPNTANTGRDIDDECVVHELISQKSESRFSHERKPSYSSSEKSMSVSSSGHLKGKLHLATCGNVKLRDTSSLNRQRRHGIVANGGLAGKEEQPHSSSGNWSASSESGRVSIGSEITIQPKSSASNTSLNVSSFHPGSGPPSSMLSRRRFLNTSASSSVTSEGTATPDLQVVDGAYPNHLDDETSSAYSCDTEGYYTSFHMDSGLRTLKEEEPPMTPLQRNQNLHTSNYSFGSQSNQTVLTAENEYELFGRGSTSTTTSSAGTVCTTLMVNGEQSSLNSVGPDVPERISSLGKLNKSNHSNSASTSTLERSYSSSTIGSTLERTGTIKRNVNASLKLSTAEAENIDGVGSKQATETPESQDEEFDFEQRVRRRAAQPLPSVSIVSEVECSECSDLEGVERIERIKQKTAINAKRIPSMCIITPTTSDDENQSREGAFDGDKTLTNESSPSAKAAAKAEAKLQLEINEVTGYCTVSNDSKAEAEPLTPTKTGKDYNLNVLKRNSNYAFNNMFEKLKVVLPSMKRSPGKSATPASVLEDDELYDTAGEYVTIADISNNNRHNQLPAPKAVGASGLGIYYSNDIVRRKFENAAEPAQGDELAARQRETEYVSLNELPQHLRKIAVQSSHNETTTSTSGEDEQRQPAGQCAEAAQQSELAAGAAVPMYAEISEVREQSLVSPPPQHKGARVRVNSQGKIIYDSDSLKRRKGAHTTFAPGPYVKETESALPGIASEQSQSQTDSESVPAATKAGSLVAKTAAAKLLLLNGGVSANRKVANVRPIVATSPLTQQAQRQQQSPNITTNSNSSNMYAAYSYQDNKNMLANNTNPFFQSNIIAASGPTMMPSPSTKSTSSTGSTTSTNSAHTNSSGGGGGSGSGSSTSSSKEEGYQRFYKTNQAQLQAQPMQPHEETDHPPSSITAAMEAVPFQRNSPIYWTLQNRRQSKPQQSSVTCRDDLYATPIRRSERAGAAAARAAASGGSTGASSNISPIVPRSRGAFQTSTPTRMDETQADNGYTPSKQPLGRSTHWDDNSPERFNTCSDRIGHSKTSLMDFKKLLLAKSTKSSPVQKKVSAVELLKKTNAAANNTTNTAEGNAQCAAPQALNSSMKLLDLSGSPKTFANRRMLRQGQFGSPSKTFAPKLKPSPGSTITGSVWRGNAQRTDIISTTIPEANSEEDHSNTNSSGNSSHSSCTVSDSAVKQPEKMDNDGSSAQRFDLKRNFFLQTEENNFMRGELKPTFGKGATAAMTGGSNKYVSGPVSSAVSAVLKSTPLTDASNYSGHSGISAVSASTRTVTATATATTTPALETAL